MDRGERRHRTEKVYKRRLRQWHYLMPCAPAPKPGRGRVRSYFDCGKTDCWICANKTRRPDDKHGDIVQPGLE